MRRRLTLIEGGKDDQLKTACERLRLYVLTGSEADWASLMALDSRLAPRPVALTVLESPRQPPMNCNGELPDHSTEPDPFGDDGQSNPYLDFFDPDEPF